MRQPKIAAVIPAYNRAHCIQRAIASAHAQSVFAVDIYVVDDGSTDDTARAVKDMQTYNTRLHLIQHPHNRGVSAARNTGIAQALKNGAEFILPFDSDDVLHPDRVKKGLQKFWSLPPEEGQNTIILCDARKIASDGNIIELKSSQLADLGAAIAAKGISPGVGSTMFAHRDVFERNGNYNTNLSCLEDYEWVLRHLVRGGEVVSIAEALVDISYNPNKTYADHMKCSEYVRTTYQKSVAEVFGPEIANKFRYNFRLANARVLSLRGQYGVAMRELCKASWQHPFDTARHVIRYVAPSAGRPVTKQSTSLTQRLTYK